MIATDKFVSISVKQKSIDVPSDWGQAMTTIYASEANRIDKEKTFAELQKKAKYVDSVAMKSEHGKFIQKYGNKINYGCWKVNGSSTKNELSIKLAGVWQMEAGDDGEWVLVRKSINKFGGLTVNDEIQSTDIFADLNGSKVNKGDYLSVRDIHEGIVELMNHTTGMTQVVSARDVMNFTKRREMDNRPAEQRKTAAAVVPKKFQEMIKAKTGFNNPDLDMMHWNEFTTQAGGRKLNDYEFMQSYVDSLFLRKQSSQMERTAVDKETKEYYEELWGDVAPEYAKELTASEKMKKKMAAIRNDYELFMRNAPSRNAYQHHNNTIAKLANKYHESTRNIMNIIHTEEEIKVY